MFDAPVIQAQAASVPSFIVYALTPYDLNLDGNPDMTIIDASFHTERDQIIVYDTAGDMTSSADWTVATDFDDDVWLFDAGADDNMELIIRFQQQNNSLSAELYDDVNRDGKVAYQARYHHVNISESRYWKARVILPHLSWFDSQGQLYRDVTVQVDGPVGDRGFDIDAYQSTQYNDGIIDLTMECKTMKSWWGRAYCLTGLARPSAAVFGSPKIKVAANGYPLPEIRGYAFWPHLGLGLTDATYPQEIRPILRIDWDNAQFYRQGLTNSLISEGPEAGWWSFSSAALEKGRVNQIDFENPFALYDLAADVDGWPELIIRHVYWLPSTLKASGSPSDGALQLVRYTWDQDNDGIWNYKLGLLGRNVITTTLNFPDFSIVSLPYERIPAKVIQDMRWDGITFIEVEDRDEHSPEGVYEWDGLSGSYSLAILGLSGDFDVEMNIIRAGFRGEFATGTPLSPILYISPIDRKVHLLGAHSGVWNIDDSTRLRYTDLDSDGYVDEWLRTYQSDPANASSEQVVESLRVVDGWLIYQTGDQVTFTQAEIARGTLGMAPPTNHEQWLAWTAALERSGSDQPTDLGQIARRYSGPALRIGQASLDAVRVSDAGFRAELRLDSGFAIESNTIGLDMGILTAGSYLIEDADGLAVQPLTPPALQFEDFTAAPLEQYQWTSIRAKLTNNGLQDARQVDLLVTAALGASPPMTITHERIGVLAGEAYELDTHWWPAKEGSWTITLQATPLDPGHPAGLQSESFTAAVAPAAPVRMVRLEAPFDGVRFSWTTLLLLLAICVIGTTSLCLILRREGQCDPGAREEQ